jgi:uncharacterized protein
MSRKLIPIIAILISVCLLVILIASWIFSSMILYPESNCRTEHYVYCGDPSEIPLEFEDVDLETSDKVRLSGWYMSAEDSDKTIVMVHGHGGSRNEGLRFAAPLVKSGFNVLAYNSRVLSEGDAAFSSMGYHEVNDVIAAVDFVIKAKKARVVGVLGFSMGAATAVMGMARDERIKAGLFSSSYANMVDEMAEVGERDFGLPRFPVLSLAILMINVRGNMDLYAVAPEKDIPLISPRPVFLMHCDGDDYVDYSHAKRLFEAAGEPKGLWTAHCNKHEYLWNANPEKAEQVVTEFFINNL